MKISMTPSPPRGPTEMPCRCRRPARHRARRLRSAGRGRLRIAGDSGRNHGLPSAARGRRGVPEPQECRQRRRRQQMRDGGRHPAATPSPSGGLAGNSPSRRRSSRSVLALARPPALGEALRRLMGGLELEGGGSLLCEEVLAGAVHAEDTGVDVVAGHGLTAGWSRGAGRGGPPGV